MNNKKKAEILARNLPANLTGLADQIARKPTKMDSRWAKSITEAFSLYTRTSTVNLFVAMGDLLRESGWPFPVYLNLESERKRLLRAMQFNRPLLYNLFSMMSMDLTVANLSVGRMGESQQQILWRQEYKDKYMSIRFRRASKKVFASWKTSPLLQSKKKIILDLEKAYNGKLWGTCIPSILPLIDYLMREYFQTNDLTSSVDILWQAFKIANIIPEDTSHLESGIKPGYGTWEIDSKKSNLIKVAHNEEEDLRLPGVYLTSLVDFARRYYSFHRTASNPTEVNRHAILHGDMNYWSVVQTTKVLMFFDLLIQLEPVLRIIIGDSFKDHKES